MDQEQQTRWFGIRMEVFQLAALALAYGQYHALQVMTEIQSLPTLIVFIPMASV